MTIHRNRILIRATLGALLLLVSPSIASAAFVSLTGKVTDVSGAGIFGVQITFVDACTGLTAGSTGNVTSSTGTFSATVASGSYDVEFAPPAGTLFTAHRILDFDLTASRTLAPIALPFGVIVSGRVTDPNGVGIFDVYLHFFPPGSSERVYTVRDKTDSSGNYSVVVGAGTYDLHYGPPLGTQFVARANPSVSIPGNTALATVVLQTGFLVTGKVLDTVSGGRPVINVNINAVDNVTGVSITLSHDRTDPNGNFTVVVPSGTYVIEYKPEKCTLLVGQRSAPTQVVAAITMPEVNLPPGVLVKGTVTDTRGAPVFDVNLVYIDSVTKIHVVTSDDHSDATGAYSAVVALGTYSIEYSPPVGLRLAGVKNTGVVVGANPQILANVQLPDAFFVSGSCVAIAGGAVPNVDLTFFAAGTTTVIFTAHHHADSQGQFSVPVAPGTFDIRLVPPVTTLAAIRLFGVNITGDRSLGKVRFEQGFAVSGTVTDSNGQPVFGADLDFFDFYSGQKVETPNDNSDSLGNYSVVVPPRFYNVMFVPPLGVNLETVRLSGVPITAVTTGLNAVLHGAVTVSGFVRNGSGVGVANVDLNFYRSDTGARQFVSRDNTALDGTYSIFVPVGTYDILFTPLATDALAPLRLSGVAVSGDTSVPDVFLSPSLTPTISSISPTSGSSAGGVTVTVRGSNFQTLMALALGGLSLFNVQVLDPATSTATTPGFHIGASPVIVDLTAANVGAPAALLTGAFTYQPAPTPVTISITRASPTLTLSWPSTGQPYYTVFRSTDVRAFGQPAVVTILPSNVTSFADTGADVDGNNYFYLVQ